MALRPPAADRNLARAGRFSIEASPHAPHRSGHGPAGGSLLRSNPCACWRKRWARCGATVRFYRLGDDCLRPSKAEALFLAACLARGAPVASGPCHDRPNQVARFAAQRHIGNFGMISQIAAKPELSKAAHLGSYWFCSGSISFRSS